MRIAIVGGPHISVPPSQYGGTEQVIYYLIQGLLEAGHEVKLLGTPDSSVDCEIIPIVDKALAYPKTKRELPEFERKLELAYKETARQLRKILPEVDVIHSHGFDLSKFADFPNVTTLHGSIGFKELNYYMNRRELNYVSISKNQRETCPELNYLATAYNAEDSSKFPVITEPQDYVCFLGRFDDEKNPHLAIELALKLGIKIKLAGKIDFAGEEYFEKQIKKYLKHPLVEYLGEIGFDKKVELLGNARCNLHPTGWREPFGLSVLEAAYCGTPTLAIARGSMPELIKDGYTGALVEDFVEGYFAIRECFGMDRKYISKRTRLTFDYRTMTRQYIKAYKKAIRLAKPARQAEILQGIANTSPKTLDLVGLE